jgi:O-acetyl-ADP-ribose deacetylase (regulator of RNase III)
MDHVFRLAREHGVRTIAVPAVGTGIAGFPMDECAHVMSDCVDRAVAGGWQPEEIRFVLFGDNARGTFEEAFRGRAK